MKEKIDYLVDMNYFGFAFVFLWLINMPVKDAHLMVKVVIMISLLFFIYYWIRATTQLNWFGKGDNK